jgi:GDP-4-dehydro-6-deoxy-D-mannose reductase
MYLTLFKALLGIHTKPRILCVSSSDVYAPGNDPRHEESAISPGSPYGISKYVQELIAQYYARMEEIPVIRVRPFAYTGPRQKDIFAVPSFAHQIAKIERGDQDAVIRVGNLEAARDYTDVRDIARGYIEVFLRGKPNEVYNLSSGNAVSLRYILEKLISMSNVPVRIEIDPSRARPQDTPLICGNSAKVRTHVGWEPQIQFGETLRDVLTYWRQIASNK